MIDRVFGVDFSGAKLAGVNIWIAQVDLSSKRLVAVDRLGALCGCDDRTPALAYLVKMVLESKGALWGMDFPFALPIEVGGTRGFASQLASLMREVDEPNAYGRRCCDLAASLGREMHIRRDTDKETKTPFDCYHYRIICQTFYGMRLVLQPLHDTPGTVIPPFDHPPKNYDRVVLEACPGSTLKRWGVPHNNYKQPTGGPLERKRIVNRRIILAKLREFLEIDDRFVRIMQRNPGGDAMDAVIAAVGAWQGWEATDFDAVRAHPRYRLEGRIFA